MTELSERAKGPVVVSNAPSVTEASAIELVGSKLYVLPNPYILDGRICTHPLSARGYSAENCYLFVEDDRAVLVDTGFTIHQESMIGRLEQILRPGMSLELSVLRVGEYYGACNVRPLVEHFGVSRVYSNRNDLLDSADFRPEYPPLGLEDGFDPFAELDEVQVKGKGQIDLGNGRRLRMIKPPLRLLSNNWLYDEGTRTLLTADQFNYSWSDTPNGPWVTDAGTALPTARQVRDFMVGTRYWWLPGARTQTMVEDLDKIFADNEVERIGPSFGPVIDGADAVREHVRLLLGVLSDFQDEPATGVDAGYTERSKRAPEAGVA
jgi:glyoxylase-like metal-dependent hydrolase (beta-lactamase superfamily II)